MCNAKSLDWFCPVLFVTTFVAMAAHAFAAPVEPRELPEAGVTMKTDDAFLQRLYDAAEKTARTNIVQFTADMKAMVEGGGYEHVWIETQPMAGAMYAKRDLRIGLNNQLIFMQCQRADGRLPGMISSTEISEKEGWDKAPAKIPFPGGIYLPNQQVTAFYGWFQGYCFPDPALDVYYLIGRDKTYLRRLYEALEAHDAYLWRTRDSNGDGVLELWCMFDNGEDNSVRMFDAPNVWPYDYPPTRDRLPDLKSADAARYWPLLRGNPQRPRIEAVRVPYQSMDVMAWSYEGRRVLADISAELGNGKEKHWRRKADEVQRRLVQSLWRPEKHACYDRDKNGQFMNTLLHNNLRCMWYGVFTQAMADDFIRYHLLNPKEFWTPMPLPSIAANDPLFRNGRNNDWSGQPQGLTYQRAIRALENYGHYAEVTLIGETFLHTVGKTCRFRSQWDPFTAEPDDVPNVRADYGPTILAVLEYISRANGIHIDREQVLWSGLPRGQHTLDYTQRWGDKTYALHIANGQMTGSLNGRELFRSTVGVRVVTDVAGNVQQVIGIAPQPQYATLHIGSQAHGLKVAPNAVWAIGAAGEPSVAQKAPFDYPYHPPATDGK
jgi:hypothetical protein